ncbi:hypothetical protein HQ576_02195 [bacterium]|nr:hypothetical protein [bacterium]
MKEIIQELLGVEKQARQIVAGADEAARHRVAEARTQAHQLGEQRRQQAAAEAQALVDELVGKARADRQARLDEARARSRQHAQAPAPLVQQAIDAVCRALAGGPHDPQR